MDQSIPQQDLISDRWRSALLEFDSTLPRPVADAMIQNATRGPLGESLRQLEECLSELERVQLEQITGSEARTVLAILIQMDRRVIELQAKIRQLWDPPSE